MGRADGFEVALDLTVGTQGELTSFVEQVLDAMPFTSHMAVGVESVGEGRAEISLPADDRFTNHVGTVHAIAELSPAETCGGVAITTALPDLLRDGYVPIAKSLHVDWLAPARGKLVATATLTPREAQRMRAAAATGERVACALDIPVRDAAGTVVAEVRIDYVLKQVGGTT